MKVWVVEVGHVHRGGSIHWEFESVAPSRQKAIKILHRLHPEHPNARAAEYDMSTGRWVGYSVFAAHVVGTEKESTSK
jgi:hypothetical protein